MAWPRFPFGKAADTEADRAARDAALKRSADWEQALAHDRLPSFVEARLGEARAGQTPWTSTMTPAELLLAVTRGIRPVATVTGTCWYQYGRSWTEGHAAGWRSALHRLRAEAVACGANAVVDVKMRTVQGGFGASMDFTLIGTAIKVQGLAASNDPIIATAPLMDFVRLLQAGIVPVGLAVGAQYEWLIDQSKAYSGSWTWNNQELATLSRFWEQLRRAAYRELKADTARQGNGVLAHTQLSQLIKQEGSDKGPDRYLGRHIVLGTVVLSGESSPIPRGIETVVDMCDGPSPLDTHAADGSNIYGLNEREGAL
ncbi:MAG TPA: heavy metal-binding domain-containing protein [Caulobacteraceae bacterium]|jgi:hypothetical protein